MRVTHENIVAYFTQEEHGLPHAEAVVTTWFDVVSGYLHW